MLHPNRVLILVSVLIILYFVHKTTFYVLPKEKVIPQNPMTVVTEPRIVKGSQLIVVQPKNTSKKIQILAPQFPFFEYGDKVIISGKFVSIFEPGFKINDISYFLANNIIYSCYYPKINFFSKSDYKEPLVTSFRKNLIKTRKSLEIKIAQSLPEPQAGLLSGILLGTRSEISKDTKEILTKAGLIHIIALSGYNISIVAVTIRSLLRKISAKIAFWGSLASVWIFVASTGFPASVVRAAIMGSILLLSKKIGRRGDGLAAILLASITMVLINPNILLYDIGFQLSFAAVCGIIFLAPRIRIYFDVFGRTFGEILAATISAQIFTFGLISFYFGRVSFVSLISNLLVVPIIPFLMLIGFLGSLISFFSIWLSALLFKLSWFLLAFVLNISKYFSELSYSEIGFRVSLYELLLIYFLLFILALFLRKKDLYEKRNL